MVSKCANPDCAMPFLYFGKGKLFLLEIHPDPEPTSQYEGTIAAHKGPSRRQLFWLCDGCCSEFVVRMILGKLELLPRNGVGGPPFTNRPTATNKEWSRLNDRG